MGKSIKVIDLFAGPGGLGEGFSSIRTPSDDKQYNIALSIEKDSSASNTLKLRSFYRQFKKGSAPDAYYDFLAGKLGKLPEIELYKNTKFRKQVALAHEETQQLELGKNNRKINSAIENALGKRPGHWVLIGGPPCQAYSVVGRSRNRGVKGYRPEKDERNFLYKEYLKVISRFQPSIFVMENVKGILSTKINDFSIFQQIYDDLKCPARTLKSNDKIIEYQLFSFVHESDLDILHDHKIKPSNFVIRAENFGIPQSRHRVILLGIRNDLAKNWSQEILHKSTSPNVIDVIGYLPKIRSQLSKQKDGTVQWQTAINKNSHKLISVVKKHHLPEVSRKMEETIEKIRQSDFGIGSNWTVTKQKSLSSKLNNEHIDWYQDPSGWRGICNHETRRHIIDDLYRYLFCACYSSIEDRGNRWSPKSFNFPEMLAPNHGNWNSGHFADRFRVQNEHFVASTITSHLSKDGHYFIHYDPAQCRSLTVREVARLQTFPDNYFFVGNRTQQYVQVGNAVPPYLAYQLAYIVAGIINNH